MIEEILTNGEMSVEGRLVDASNATLFVSVSHKGESINAIYKPVAGERPLWDFPDGNLASRERAAYLISEAMGVHCVPITILRDGPFGLGMVQQWIDIDEDIDLEMYFREDLPELRAVALFDAVINNTDRKIGHLLPSTEGKLFVCDHGVTFHIDDKLRTVLWQWAGHELNSVELMNLRRLSESVSIENQMEIHTLITEEEIAALRDRVNLLIAEAKFPHPNPDWPHIPWPPF
ncbi:hypothetical protein MCEMRE196_00725 [Candidatus Nanopelagicaceae bacterium]